MLLLFPRDGDEKTTCIISAECQGVVALRSQVSPGFGSTRLGDAARES